MALGTVNQSILATDKSGKNFLLQIPFHANGLARNAPNRRFLKGQGVWFLPGFRMNALYLQNVVIPAGIIVEPAAKDLINKIIGRTDNTPSMFPTWYKFKTKPYDKQLEALDAAWGKKYFAFTMEMGTGKSKVYTDLACALCMEGKIDAMVILTKKTLRRNILCEVAKHAPWNIPTFAPDFDTPSAKKKAAAFIHQKEKLKAVSVGLESLSTKVGEGQAFEWLWEFMKCHRVALFVDESHLIKEEKSIRSINSCKLGGMADYRFIGTGTPVDQGILDLYSQYEFLDTDIIGIGNFWSFRGRYTIKGGYKDREVIGYDNLEELMELIRPWTFQVTKSEMVDLPEKIYMEPIVVEMSPEQRRIYNEVRRDKVVELSSMKGAPAEVVCKNVLSAYSLLHQIAAGFISYDTDELKITKKKDGTERVRAVRDTKWIMPPEESPKLREMMELIGRNPGKQFNIWTKHILELLAATDMLTRAGYSAASYFGGVPDAERKILEERFKTGDLQFLVANQETGGTGLTFTNCSDVLYLSNSFKYIDRAQSEDRNHRIGTVRPVTYTDMVMSKSIDLRVIAVLREKGNLADYVKKQLARGVLFDEE